MMPIMQMKGVIIKRKKVIKKGSNSNLSINNTKYKSKGHNDNAMNPDSYRDWSS